jgi:transposase
VFKPVWVIIDGMKQPAFVRSLTDDEQQRLKAGIRSRNLFTIRRCQILLASARGQPTNLIAKTLGCSIQTARNAIAAFNSGGLDCLQAKSSRPKKLRTILDESKREQVRAMLHQSPRNFGKPTSLWTLDMVAEVCCERGLTDTRLSRETIRQAVKRLGVNWRRAKDWITSPDEQYLLKKRGEIG